MFNKKNRITKKKEIENIFKKGKSFYNEFFGFKFLENNLHCNRFCIIVSSKVSKKAVIRNKIKRQVRAIIISNDIKKNFDFLIIANKGVINLSFLEIKNSLECFYNKNNFYV